MEHPEAQPLVGAPSQARMVDSLPPQSEQAELLSCTGICPITINSGTVGVVQRFGNFVGYTEPGLYFYCCPCESVQAVSIAVSQMQCTTECKTKDNVTLTITTAVQYRIDKRYVKQAIFEIDNPQDQIKAFCDNIVRSSLPTLDLDDAYAAKETLCNQILHSIRNAMGKYGYEIISVLIVDLAPEPAVLAAMNEINAARRKREAAIEQGEAQKVLQVKQAEAEAEAKHLSGVGVAKMRKAIADGFKESMLVMGQGGLQPQEAMHMLVVTQYLDTLKSFAENPSTSTIVVPHGPGAVKDIETQVREGFLTSLAGGRK